MFNTIRQNLCLFTLKHYLNNKIRANPGNPRIKNSVNPAFGKKYVNIYSRVARFEQARLQRTLIREYKSCRRRLCQSYFSVFSVFSVVKKIRVNSCTCPELSRRNQRLKNAKVANTGCLITMLFYKTNPILCVFSP